MELSIILKNVVSVPIWGLFNLTKTGLKFTQVETDVSFRPHLGII